MPQISRRDLFKGAASAAAVSALPVALGAEATFLAVDASSGVADATIYAEIIDGIMRDIAAMTRIPVRYLTGEGLPLMEESDAQLLARLHERLLGDA